MDDDNRDSCSRRTAVGRIAGAMSLYAFGGTSMGRLAEHVARTWPGYKNATVIDFLASVGPFNTTAPATPLTDAMVRNAKDSGSPRSICR